MVAPAIQPDSLCEYLAYSLGEEGFAVDIRKVREIRSYERPTRIAGSAAHVRGVIDLRGTIVPIVDMRIHAGLENPRLDDSTVVIILDLGQRTIGMVVDGVSDVMRINAKDVRPVPEMNGFDADYVTRLATHDGKMLMVVDVAALFGTMAGSAATVEAT
jgi:purine-binding chemotaxis protein CheW